MAKILLLESEISFDNRLVTLLGAEGHTCIRPETIANGLDLPAAKESLVIMSTRLSYGKSKDFLAALQRQQIPVLFMAEDMKNAAHLKALIQGHCAVLPEHSPAEVIRQMVTELLNRQKRMLIFGSLKLDRQERVVTLMGRRLSLTAQEYELLKALMASPDSAVSREQLLKDAWGYQDLGVTRTVDVHIQRLRRKLGQASIETVYRTGYRLNMA